MKLINILTPYMVYEEFQNSLEYSDKFTFDGICGIFEYLEEYYEPNEYVVLCKQEWVESFHESENAVEFLKEMNEYDKFIKEYKINLDDEPYETILSLADSYIQWYHEKYEWDMLLPNNRIIVKVKVGD